MSNLTDGVSPSGIRAGHDAEIVAAQNDAMSWMDDLKEVSAAESRPMHTCYIYYLCTPRIASIKT
jgi:hypothetical protein